MYGIKTDSKLDNLSENDFLILDPYKAEKKNMLKRLLLRGDCDSNNYKKAKIKGFAICIYSDARKYTFDNIKVFKEF